MILMDRFPDVLGHDALKERLGRLLADDRLPNGILFYGEEGRGKRTLACAFAREVLRDADAADPSGAAREADLGRHPALVVVEPLPEERLMPVRRLRSMMARCGLTIPRGDRRVVVLPRLHRVNVEGGNTLLKFLEEPPPGTLIVATARDPGSVLETIRSRLVMLPCGPLDGTTTLRVLERRGFSPDEARWLAPLCEGAPGAAFRFARGDVDAHLIEPLRAVFGADPAADVAKRIEKIAKDAAADWIEARESIGPSAAIAAWKDLRAAQEIGADDEKASEGTLEPVRVFIRPILEAVGAGIRMSLRASSGSQPLTPPWSEWIAESHPLRSGSLATAERAATAVVRALENLDRNLSVQLVIETMVTALRAR